jgi:Flp pilus assembly protein TadG
MLLEFAVVAPCLVMLFFGTVGLGIMLGRYIQAEFACRDIAHMYSDGVDFTQTTPQNIIVQQLAAGTGITATGGTGVVILSQVMTVYQADCNASGYTSQCTNLGIPVFTQRIYVGNSTLHSSAFGTPTSTLMDSEGNISPSVYITNSDSSVQATGFATALSNALTTASVTLPAPPQYPEPQGDSVYVVETFFPYPDIGFLGWSTAGGTYARFMFY